MKLFPKKKQDAAQRLLPRHVGIIMDGNGRWAQKRGLPRSAGHTVGAANFKTITRYCSAIGIPYLTVYAFSTENWKRPDDEISGLLFLFKQYLQDALTNFLEDDIQVRFIGDTSAFPRELQDLIAETEEVSKNRTGMVLNIAMNYGGRSDIVSAVRQIAQEVRVKGLPPEEITQEMVSGHLSTAGQPDPDLIIRPSGECRISNFLLWQSAYAELVFMDILWPDFKAKDLERALDEYRSRRRRFGGI